RWYCRSCGTYAPITVKEKKAPPVEKKPENACSKCGRPLRYISQYKRWYCDHCKAYEGVKKVKPKAAPVPPATRRCTTCGSTMKYVPKRKRYYCYTCQSYKPVAKPKPVVSVAVVPRTRAPAARPAAVPEAVRRDGTAMAGSILVIMGMLFFIITGLMTLMVYTGSMDPINVYESENHKLTLQGDFMGSEVDSVGTTIYTFNILLFLAILFAGFGVAMYGFSMAKWLPRIAQKK
ncbi:MAG: zinc ribbon domain-containing protein, partial [Thermoplasmata archaeon]|nr:zinc ribbon domain-containing protein [Thermoplasmata archaeon]